MKATRLLAILAVAGMLASTSAFAASLTGMGIKAGLDLANCTGDDSEMPGMDKGMRMGIVGGGFVQIGISDVFAVEPGVQYNQGGAKYEATGVTATAKYDYVEIPVLLRVTIPTQGKVKPSVFLGPSLGILMGAKIDVEVTGLGSAEVDVKDVTKSTNIALNVGAGVAIPAGKGKVMLDVAYGMGLTSLDDSGADADVKTSAIMVLAGYSFK